MRGREKGKRVHKKISRKRGCVKMDLEIIREYLESSTEHPHYTTSDNYMYMNAGLFLGPYRGGYLLYSDTDNTFILAKGINSIGYILEDKVVRKKLFRKNNPELVQLLKDARAKFNRDKMRDHLGYLIEQYEK